MAPRLPPVDGRDGTDRSASRARRSHPLRGAASHEAEGAVPFAASASARNPHVSGPERVLFRRVEALELVVQPVE